MYAIIECGGKQYKVAKDDLVRVEKLDAEVGAKVELKERTRQERSPGGPNWMVTRV